MRDRGRDVRGSRDAVLGRIRSALRDAPAIKTIPRDYQLALDPSIDIVELFVERVEDYRATVHRTTEAELSGTVAEVLAAHGAKRIAVPGGVPAGWLAQATGEAVADDPPLSKLDLDGLDGVITGCALAIAETGTFVLDGGPGQGRRALTLVPDLHICVVREDQVVGLVPEAVGELEGAVRAGRPLTFVSGPSATSDIELDRVEGVHGPRVLHVVLVA